MEEGISTSAIETVLTEPAISPDGNENEQKLAEEIQTLWAAHNQAQAASKKSKEELRAIRLELGRRLSEVKSLISRPGRGGGWTAFLSANSIPRASGDRLVLAYKKSLEPPDNRLGESISEPSKETAEKLAKGVWPSVKKVLTSDESILHFIGWIVTASGIKHEWCAEGLMIFKPVPTAADGLQGSAIASPGPASEAPDETSGDTEEPASETTAATPATEVLGGVAEAHMEAAL